MEIVFEPAAERDYERCWRLYFSQMEKTLRELNLDPVAHEAGFRQKWVPAQVEVIRLVGRDVGWLQVVEGADELFLAQIFIDPEHQNQGIGTIAIGRVMKLAGQRKLPLALAVVKGNRAVRLYTRLGFRIVGEDRVKHYMQLDPQGDGNTNED